MTKKRSLTSGELIQMLAYWPSDTKVIFQGPLSLYRIKERGPGLVQVEFNEAVGDAMKRLPQDLK